MNERIQELVKQFAVDLLNRSAIDMREYEPFLEETEKFVESIVWKCVKLCDQVDIVGADECIDNIKEHFGVEK